MKNEDNESQILNKHSSVSKIPEYNFLLLGESGVGKSTTINAWANYMRYKSFEEAKYGDFELMVSAKSKLPDPVTKEPNEIRSASAYTFKFKDKVLRMIDIPGFEDNRESTLNNATINPILTYLNNYKELNAIVILFNANQIQTTSCFRHFISELFKYLHKDASKNLMFCFTFSKNTNLQACDGYHTVKFFLERDLPEVEFELKSGENCFFIDNDSFRFLTAMKKGYTFDTKQEQSKAEQRGQY